jgi:hypothetical protein
MGSYGQAGWLWATELPGDRQFTKTIEEINGFSN